MKSTKILTILVLVLGLVSTASADLVAHYEFEGNADDSSGNGLHGILIDGASIIVDPERGNVLSLDGVGDYVDCGNDPRFDITKNIAVTSWIKVDAFDKEWQAVVTKGDSAWRLHRWSSTRKMAFFCTAAGGGRFRAIGTVNVNDGQWHHVAGVYNGSKIKLFMDGMLDNSEVATKTINTNTFPVLIGENAEATGRNWSGLIDDVRIYNNLLTGEEVRDIMKGGNLYASNPDPPDGATVTVRVDENVVFSWNPGDNAASHNVYFGSVDPPPLVVNQTENSYDPVLLELDETYYWRVNEVDTDGTTIHRGDVWSFTTGDSIILDDFERYTDGPPNRINDHWIDGSVNGTGSKVSLGTQDGSQMMVIDFDNTGAGGKSNFSEVSRTFGNPQDFSGAAELSLWVMEPPPFSWSFTDHSDGTFTVTGSGADIWGDADGFSFAYKELTGPGSIVARVESVENTNNWDKAGVMIRETLEPGSKNAFIGLTPENGMVVQHRDVTGGETFELVIIDDWVMGPGPLNYWPMLELDDTGRVTASHSGDGSTWDYIINDVLQNLRMPSNAWVGLAVTGEAVFSNVTITGTVGQQWMNQDIGIVSNDAEPIYVAIADSDGSHVELGTHDPGVTIMEILKDWKECTIPLETFSNQVVDLTDIERIAIGVGTPGNMTIPGGSGNLFVDDLRLYWRPPEKEPEVQCPSTLLGEFILGSSNVPICDCYNEHPHNNCLPACDGGPCEVADKPQDIWGMYNVLIDCSPKAFDEISGKYSCGYSPDVLLGSEKVDVLVGCPSSDLLQSGDYMSLFVQSQQPPARRYVLLIVQFGGDIPLNDDTNSYQYAFVFDADGRASNNYEPWPDFPNDFFAYTDKWYELTYSPDFGWEFFVTDVRKDFALVQSDVLFIIAGSEMAILVPLDEFDIDTPTFRATAFRHTGDFGMSGGPWSGDLSSLIGEPLLPIAGAESVIVIEE